MVIAKESSVWRGSRLVHEDDGCGSSICHASYAMTVPYRIATGVATCFVSLDHTRFVAAAAVDRVAALIP